MSTSVIDPCAWPIEPGPCCENLDADPAVVDAVIARVSDIMRTLSGRMIGLCAQTIRPLHMCPTCRSTCCGGADGIPLSGQGGEPIAEVLQVRIGPDVVDPATYWFEDGMLWLAPPGKWPTRDPKWQQCGDGGAFCVDVLAGVEPDDWALDVAGELVCELVKSCTGQKCRLPRNTTSISAQGVTVTLEASEMMSLIPEVAGWVRAVNPHGAVLPAAVWSPDTADGSYRRNYAGRSLWRR